MKSSTPTRTSNSAIKSLLETQSARTVSSPLEYPKQCNHYEGAGNIKPWRNHNARNVEVAGQDFFTGTWRKIDAKNIDKVQTVVTQYERGTTKRKMSIVKGDNSNPCKYQTLPCSPFGNPKPTVDSESNQRLRVAIDSFSQHEGGTFISFILETGVVENIT